MNTTVGLGHGVRLDYHQRLLTDPHRMVAYQRALERLVEPGMVVLDAGAGTGVLAMMAARLGAAKVYAVESMPVARLARELVRHNGLERQVEVVEADLRAMAPRGAVDLVVSDCLGRFLYDDQMLEAMKAAFSWLRPGGRVAPSLVELVVAPVAAGHLPLVDAFVSPVLGLELAPLRTALLSETWGGAFAPEAVLAEPQVVGRWELPGTPPVVDLAGTFSLRAGRLIGLAGWFRATLAPGVVLETGPGFETHWHQVFWPWPATAVEDGARLEVQLRLEALTGGPSGEPRWSWSGRVDGRPLDVLAEAMTPLVEADGERLDDEGAELFSGGELDRARERFERAATAPGRHGANRWDNLGIARFEAGEYALAVAPLLMAFSDEPEREQTMRLLVSAAFLSGRQVDGARWLAEYERRHGPHPAGWRRG